MGFRDADLDNCPAVADPHGKREEGAALNLSCEEVANCRLHLGARVERQQDRMLSPFDTAQRGAEQRIELRDAQRLLLRGERALEWLELGRHLAISHVHQAKPVPRYWMQA